MRGLIISPAVEVQPSKSSTLFIGPIEMQLLRFWLLYWDEFSVFWPSMIGPGIGGSVETNYLITTGRLKLYEGELDGELSDLLVKSREQGFKKLEAENPGRWAVATGEGTWVNKDEPNDDFGRALQFTLTKALPVPNQDVPLDELLQFAERRKDERAELLSLIDETYQSVVASPDRPLAEHAAIEKIARNAKAQLELINEAKLPFRLMDLISEFNLAAALLGTFASVPFGVTWPQAVGNGLIAGASASVKQVAAIVNPKKLQTPYRYIASYNEEVFRPE